MFDVAEKYVCILMAITIHIFRIKGGISPLDIPHNPFFHPVNFALPVPQRLCFIPYDHKYRLNIWWQPRKECILHLQQTDLILLVETTIPFGVWNIFRVFHFFLLILKGVYNQCSVFLNLDCILESSVEL